jgi:TnpA family transposase
MIMDFKGRGKSMGGFKNIFMLREYILEVKMHRECLNDLNRIELRNNAKMTFFE